MKIKSKQEIYNLLITETTWEQEPCKDDDNFSIIKIKIPNRNVRVTQSLKGMDAARKLISFAANFIIDLKLFFPYDSCITENTSIRLELNDKIQKLKYL